ncbi:bile acid:sodium symporter [Myxococcota bacterium]|nr:bile acid:sodium symporter [Myxococcota bacterium]
MDPALLQSLENLVAGAFVVLLMLSVGLDLSLSGLAATLRRPAGLLAGLVSGYVLVPLVSFALAHLLELEPGARAGLLLCAVAPGGPMGAYLALSARGDVALAVALVLVFNVANTLLIPLGLTVLQVPVPTTDNGYLWDMAFMIVATQLVPLVVGAAVHKARPAIARRLQTATSWAANALLLVFGVAVVVLEGGRFLAAGWPTVLAVLGAVVASLVLGWLVSPPRREARVALASVGVIHSSSACVLLASAWFPDPATLLTVLTWAGVMFIVGVGASRWMRRGAVQAAAAPR